MCLFLFHCSFFYWFLRIASIKMFSEIETSYKNFCRVYRIAIGIGHFLVILQKDKLFPDFFRNFPCLHSTLYQKSGHLSHSSAYNAPPKQCRQRVERVTPSRSFAYNTTLIQNKESEERVSLFLHSDCTVLVMRCMQKSEEGVHSVGNEQNASMANTTHFS